MTKTWLLIIVLLRLLKLTKCVLRMISVIIMTTKVKLHAIHAGCLWEEGEAPNMGNSEEGEGRGVKKSNIVPDVLC